MTRREKDRGNATMELVLLVPILVLCALLIAWCGRLVQAKTRVELAAASGARAASMVHRHRMHKTGAAAALGMLEGNGRSCGSPRAEVMVFDEYVSVTVTCTSNDQALADFPTRTLTATASAPIDRYRAG